MKSFYYSLKEKYHEYRFRHQLKQQLRQPEAIIVHQMGKVGSTSIFRSLKSVFPDKAVCHTHFLNPKRLEDKLRLVRLKKQPIQPYLIMSQELRKVIDDDLKDKKWKIITIVREPIARNISAFFENLYVKESSLYVTNFAKKYKSGSLTIEPMIEKFIRDYPHEIPLKWLDWEIKNVFKIDVFLTDFPKSKGYQIIQNGEVDLLVLKLENIKECITEAFKEFLGLENFTLKQHNRAKQKSYYDAYKHFMDSIVLPEAYIEKMYTSKYTQHFYSKDEIDVFRAKWLRL